MICVFPICESLADGLECMLNTGYYCSCVVINFEVNALAFSMRELMFMILNSLILSHKKYQVIFAWFIYPDVNGLEITIHNYQVQTGAIFKQSVVIEMVSFF